MTKTNPKAVPESAPQPSADNWGRFKQVLRNLYDAPSSTPDHALTAQISHSLGEDSLLRKTDLAHMDVTVHAGVAKIRGHVVRSLNKARAEEIARAAPGVVGVVNCLVVDEELIIAVAQALSRNPLTQSEQFQVSVQHGVIYLGGAVPNGAVRSAVAAVAAALPQGRGVINLVKAPDTTPNTQEERFVQPQVESTIYATDGPIGRIDQVIVNPHNRRVTAVVVDIHSLAPSDPLDEQPSTEPAPAQRHRLIPLSNLRLAPSGALFLNVNSVATAGFAAFNPLHFAAPPPDWQPPYPYGWADVQFGTDDTASGGSG